MLFGCEHENSASLDFPMLLGDQRVWNQEKCKINQHSALGDTLSKIVCVLSP